MVAVTDDVVLQVSAVFNVIKEFGSRGLEQSDPLVITQAAALSNIFLFAVIYFQFGSIC